ncbi:hypothetical protein GG344DRAFT_83903 [Lentinula edodes]|nr:hypothetical protein GG344DRAFT_83903 [Lentinula edodes]
MASGLTNTLSELTPSTSTSTSAPSSSMAEPAPSAAVPTYSAHVKAAQTSAKDRAHRVTVPEVTECLSAEDEWDSSEVINNTAVTPLVPGDRE